MSFKIGFKVEDYKDILPSLEEYAKDDEIINFDQYKRGNINNCVWKKAKISKTERESSIFREREVKRVLKTGVWVAIKNEILWIPPNYYHALQYGRVGEVDLEFRLKRLKHTYEKLRARNNKFYKGTLTIKNRADGETTMAINDAFWEMMIDNMYVGVIGIQSKTREDAINPCWSTAQTFWQAYPTWYKSILYPDFASGDKIAEKMKFMRPEDEENEIKARNITFQYFPCTHNAMDGKHNVKRCILDEVCKWTEARFGTTFTNYSKFVAPGLERRGLFDMFSSPADKQNKSNEDVYELWQNSNPEELDEVTGATKSRIYRIYSNPLDGIQGAYDKWGDADPQFIYDYIMRERKNAPKDRLQEEIRGFPLNENEMFDTPDAGSIWSNSEGIKARKLYLLGKATKGETGVVYGNLEWKDGIIDSDIVFRQSDETSFHEENARFAFSYILKDYEKEPMVNKMVSGFFGEIGMRPQPPRLIFNCLGVDPYAKRYKTANSNSLAGMVNERFADPYQIGVVKKPTMIYGVRPEHADIFHEDIIKAALFNRAMINVESITDKALDYIEDRGYSSWSLKKVGKTEKGQNPSSGKNIFLNEVIMLIDSRTNNPVNPDDRAGLLDIDFIELLDDVYDFDPKNTQKSDLTMAWGQALMGAVQILLKQKKVNNPSARHILSRLLLG